MRRIAALRSSRFGGTKLEPRAGRRARWAAFFVRTLCAAPLLAAIVPAPARAQTPQPSPTPFVISVGSITQWSYGKGCDEPGPGLKTPGSSKTTQLPKYCTWVNVPFQPVHQPSPAVTFVAPSARVAFRFVIELTDPDAGAGSYSYSVNVTARDSANDPPQSASATAVLCGSKSTNAGCIKPIPPSTNAVATLTIPLNVDAAVDNISFGYTLSQGPVHSASGAQGGPFVLAVSPLYALQVPALPVAIVYGPVGNKGVSKLQLSSATGSNLQFSNSNTVGQDNTIDDKEAWSYGLSVGIGSPKAAPAASPKTTGSGTVGFTATNSWDSSTEASNSSTYGQTQSVVASSQFLTSYSPTQVVPPGATVYPSLSSSTFDYWAEPFWSDLFILATDAQYAVWDYPGNLNTAGQEVPILQPLASSGIIQVNVWTLYQCATGAVGWSPLPFGSVVLSSSDCNSLLNVDPFWVAQTQSLPSPPVAFFDAFPNRNVSGADSQFTLQSQISNAFTAGTSNAYTYSTKISSVRVNQLALSGSASATIPTPLLLTIGLTGSYTSTKTTTATGTTSIAYQTIASTTSTTTNTATQTPFDTCFSATAPPNLPNGKPNPCSSFQVSAYLDYALQGLALQIPYMSEYPNLVISNQNTHAPRAVLSKPKIPAELKSLPMLCPTCSSVSLPAGTTANPRRYIRDTGYGYVVITEPTQQQQALAQAQASQAYLAAVKRHVKRPVPKPGPAFVAAITPAQAAQLLKKLPAGSAAPNH